VVVLTSSKNKTLGEYKSPSEVVNIAASKKIINLGGQK